MKKFLKDQGVWLGLLALVFILVVLTQGDFLSPRNLNNLIRQASINGILAAGMTLVILTGGIDLSIGSLVALSGIVVGLLQLSPQFQGSLGVVVALMAALLAGLALGLVNGFLIAGLRLAPFVITLGMMVVARGLSLIFSGGSSLSPMSESLNELVGGYLPESLGYLTVFLMSLVLIRFLYVKFRSQGWPGLSDYLFSLVTLIFVFQSFLRYRGFPNLVLFLCFVMILSWILLEKTVFGRAIFALGSNEKAAYWAGVPIRKVTVLVYSFMGLLSGLAAFLLSGRLNAADPNAGQLFELDAIAAVVIGGTSLKGGSGSVIGSLIGALTMATLNNGMDLLGVSSFYQMVLKGVIIILAVSLDRGDQRAR